MEPITARTIARASYATLTQFCKQMEVPFQNQPKLKLQELLIEKLGSQAEQLPTPVIKPTRKKISEKKPAPIKNTKKVSKSKGETKSSKILALHLKGKKVSEISEALKAHPSFIYTVINKHKGSKSK